MQTTTLFYFNYKVRTNQNSYFYRSRQHVLQLNFNNTLYLLIIQCSVGEPT